MYGKLEGRSLYDYYENYLLPQFGLEVQSFKNWKSEDVGPDEIVHYFSNENDDYALIFVDYGSLGSNEEFIRKYVKLNKLNKLGGKDFGIVYPTSHSDCLPSFSVGSPSPSKYCVNVTGVFTLLKL